MRTRSTVGVAILLGCFSLASVASPALAAPKKKKPAAAAESPVEPEPAKDKSVDDMMEESTTKKSAPASSAASGGDSQADEEPVGEPDAWERPPVDEEKPKPVAAPKAEKKVGDGRTIELGISAGYGFKVGDADWATLNPYSVGFGIRGGMTFINHLYVGLGFVYHLGENDIRYNAVTGSQTSTQSAVSQNYMLAYAEGGWDIWLGDWILRPSMWLGMGFALVDPYMTLGVLQTVTDFLFAPGIDLYYTVGGGWFVGGDARWIFVTGDGAKGLDFFGVLGMRFE
jgi:hypothetical protein